jgi:hypothetical protein
MFGFQKVILTQKLQLFVSKKVLFLQEYYKSGLALKNPTKKNHPKKPKKPPKKTQKTHRKKPTKNGFFGFFLIFYFL